MPNYYTPDLSEFHVGFEYEQLIAGVWEPFTFTELKWFNDKKGVSYKYLIETKSIRVKCLDTEDIESLGFTFGYEEGNGVKYGGFKDNPDVHISWNNDSVDPTNRFELTWMIETNILNHAYRKSDLMYNHYIKASFKGTVKNKTELKKLLTQLNINNE